MRKIRNPRYAPEFLERKLSPSTYLASPTYVDVSTTSDTTSPAPAPAPTDPTDPSDPSTPPTDPSGPSGPTLTYCTA